jgi:hypothetical protein
VVSAGLRAARRFHELLEGSSRLRPYQEPELDIVTYLPRRSTPAAVDAASQDIFERAMRDADPVYVGVARVRGAALHQRHADLADDGASWVRILRSVLMKPEHELVVDELFARLEAFAE